MAKKKAKPKTATISFEQSLEQLKQIVAQLENGNLTLTESLEKYEHGVANLKQCYESLNAAQRRIELLVDLDEDGNLTTRPFDNTSSTEVTEGTRRATRSRPVDEGVHADEEVEADDEDEADDEADDLDGEDTGSLF